MASSEPSPEPSPTAHPGRRPAWLTTAEAAERLGVKPQTLYAYVSRGVVRSERVPGSRHSRFALADVERLAAQGRPGTRRERTIDVVVETALTRLDPAGHLAYRGWDVVDAVEVATYEEVATWLWTSQRQRTPFVARPEALALTARLGGVLPAATTHLDRYRVLAAALPALDPLRYDRHPAAVATTTRALVAAMVASLPLVGADEGTSASARTPPPIARRLWPRLSPLPATPSRVALLDAALVLLADHELAASTLAARVAASTWADPYAVVQAGLAALSGPLHGAASTDVRRVLQAIRAGAPAVEVAGTELRTGSFVPGFGHKVYTGDDPRAEVLLAQLARTRPERATMGALTQLQAAVATQGGPRPNVDLALGALAEAHAMVPGAGEVVFATARTVGWVAHAIEEQRHRLRFRPRAAYVGEPTVP